MEDLKEHLTKNTSNLVFNYLKPLPFLNELEEKTKILKDYTERYRFEYRIAWSGTQDCYVYDTITNEYKGYFINVKINKNNNICRVVTTDVPSATVELKDRLEGMPIWT